MISANNFLARNNLIFMFGNCSSLTTINNVNSWNVSGVTDFTDFMYGKTPLTFSTTNLDSIYNGWSTKNPKPNLNISFGSANYTISGGQAGKDILGSISGGGTYNWTITDGGGI